jgi:hypothetical protein
MKIVKLISIVGILAMTVILGYALAVGNISTEGAWFFSHPWGLVSLVDLYTGFALYSVWITYREKSLPLAIFWIVLMLGLGFWAGALYMLLTLNSSGGDWIKFWMGARA